MTRNIKQITTGTCGHSEHISYEIIALCDDNTIWMLKDTFPIDTWVQLPKIPQPEDTKDIGEFR